MGIASVIDRGFGPGGSLQLVVTHGYAPGAAIVAPPNATLVTRGFGVGGTRLPVRFYLAGSAVIVVPPPVPVVEERPAGGYFGGEGGYWPHYPHRTREEIAEALRQSRIQFGILPPDVDKALELAAKAKLSALDTEEQRAQAFADAVIRAAERKWADHFKKQRMAVEAAAMQQMLQLQMEQELLRREEALDDEAAALLLLAA